MMRELSRHVTIGSIAFVATQLKSATLGRKRGRPRAAQPDIGVGTGSPTAQAAWCDKECIYRIADIHGRLLWAGAVDHANPAEDRMRFSFKCHTRRPKFPVWRALLQNRVATRHARES